MVLKRLDELLLARKRVSYQVFLHDGVLYLMVYRYTEIGASAITGTDISSESLVELRFLPFLMVDSM